MSSAGPTELGMRTSDDNARDREVSLPKTAEQPRVEKASPPYSFGITRPKKPCAHRKGSTSGGNSRLRFSSHSSTIAQTSSTGPSRKACSSEESCGGGCPGGGGASG